MSDAQIEKRIQTLNNKCGMFWKAFSRLRHEVL